MANKAKKQQYIDTVNAEYGVMLDSTDSADAYMFYRAILKISKKPPGMTKAVEKIYTQLKEFIGNE